MKRGAAGLILLVLSALIVLIIIFAATKFVVPNPQTIEEDKRIQQDAQDAVNKYQQKGIQNQLGE